MSKKKSVFLISFLIAALFLNLTAAISYSAPGPQPAPGNAADVKTDNSDKRMVLNITRAGIQDGEKFILGTPPPAVFQDTLSSGKDVEFVRGLNVGSTGTGAVYSLKECIDIAVKNHLPLQIAKKSAKLAEMRLFEARRNMLPSATIDFQEYSGRINGLRYIGRKQTIEGQQPVFHGGELLYTMKQSEVNLEITKNDYNRT